jgi:signal transduction histidine kinase
MTKTNWLLFLLLPILWSSFCFSQSNESDTNEASQKTDSVLFYINASKKNTVTSEEHLLLLKKAVTLAERTQNDSLKTKHFSKLSFLFLKKNDPYLFKKINSKTIQLAKSTKDSTALAEAYWDRASFYNKQSVLDSAYYSYSEAQKIYEKQGNGFYSGKMLYNMAMAQNKVRDYVGSEATTIQSIERLKPLNKYKQLYQCYNNLAIVASALGDYERALQYYDRARFYINNMAIPKSFLTSNINNLGIAYLSKGDYQKASENFTEVLKTDSLQLKDPILYAKALNNLALSKIKSKDTLGAKALIQKSILLKDSLNDIQSLASSFFTLAEYNLLRQDTLTAIHNVKKSARIAKESSNNERLLESLALLTKLDEQKASIYANEYIQLNDSLQIEERKARNKFARIRFETDEFIAENEELEEEKALLSKQKQMWTGIAVGFFMLGISIYVIIDQRAKNQKLLFQQQQQANNQEIFNLMLAQKQKVDEVKRLEQKRISEELHDGVLGKMLGARMVLTGLNKKADEQAITERSQAIKALKDVEQEVRSISHELSHTAYQKLNNFVNSIETLLATAKKNSDINTVFTYDEDEDWDQLNGEIKINVYRIIQETLQNALKHAQCQNFFLNFDSHEDTLLVTSKDDGIGFNIEKERKGIGIRNLSSRIEKLNGTWQIDTAPNKGTKITMKIPLEFNTKLKDNRKGELNGV